MGIVEQVCNIYAIDTNMCSYPKYMSAFVIASKKSALIDTGLPTQIDVVRENIKATGVSLRDITHIFVTHCEHPDHGGNVGPLLRDCPEAKVYINPIGEEYLTHPEIEEAKRVGVIVQQNIAKFLWSTT